jgi:hypothetical protein
MTASRDKRHQQLRDLVRSKRLQEAALLASQIIVSKDIPSYISTYCSFVIEKSKRAESYKRSEDSVDTLNAVKACESKPESNIAYSIASDSEQNGLTKALSLNGIMLIRSEMSRHGEYKITGITTNLLSNVEAQIRQGNGEMKMGSASIIPLSDTVHEITILFENVKTSEQLDIIISMCFLSDSRRASIRGYVYRVGSCCPVATICKNAIYPRQQDIVTANQFLMIEELAQQKYSIKYHKNTLYTICVGDQHFSIGDPSCPGNSLIRGFNIDDLELEIDHSLPDDALIFFVSDDIILREDYVDILYQEYGAKRINKSAKIMVINYLVISNETNETYATNYKSSFVNSGLPFAEYLACKAWLTTKREYHTIYQASKKNIASLTTATLSGYGLLKQQVFNAYTRSCWAEEASNNFIGISYLPPIPIENARLIKQSIALDLINSRQPIRSNALVGVIGLCTNDNRLGDWAREQTYLNTVLITDFQQVDYMCEIEGNEKYSHHNRIVIDVESMVHAIASSGADYVYMVHPSFIEITPYSIASVLSVIEQASLCCSVSSIIAERRTVAQDTLRTIHGESIQHNSQYGIRVVPNVYPPQLINISGRIQIAPLVGTLYNAEHLIRSLRGNELCTARDIQVLLALEAISKGYSQYVYSQSKLMYTSKIRFNHFNNISPELVPAVLESGLLNQKPAVTPIFKPKDD